MSRPLKIVSVMIALLLLVEPAFANPIMVSPFQVTNPALAVQTLCKPKIALGAFCAPGAVSYDANSNLLSKRTRGGSVINYAYDNLNRLTTKTYPDTTSVAYSYDNASRLTSVIGSGGGAAAAIAGYGYDFSRSENF